MNKRLTGVGRYMERSPVARRPDRLSRLSGGSVPVWTGTNPALWFRRHPLKKEVRAQPKRKRNEPSPNGGGLGSVSEQRRDCSETCWQNLL